MKTFSTLLILPALALGAAPEMSTNVTTPDFLAFAAHAGFAVSTLSAEGPLSGDVLVWEARADASGELTPERAKELGEYVRQGHSLMVVMSPTPGTSAMRLGFLLPTTAWGTQVRTHTPNPIGAAAWDESFFSKAEPKGMKVPYHFEIRPVSAIERGQARYEHLAQTVAYVKQAVPPGNDFWTRPLLNRDWRVRVSGDDVARQPLLVTGRYGAGRVAVFAGPASAGSEPFWSAVMAWMRAPAADRQRQRRGHPRSLTAGRTRARGRAAAKRWSAAFSRSCCSTGPHRGSRVLERCRGGFHHPRRPARGPESAVTSALGDRLFNRRTPPTYCMSAWACYPRMARRYYLRSASRWICGRPYGSRSRRRTFER